MTISYTVSIEKPETHYYDVEMMIPVTVNLEKLNLIMPVWTPGSYFVREFSRNVLEFSATDDNSKELVSYKTSKNMWTVETKGASATIRIKYRVYAFEFTVNTSYLDTRHGIINGASVFMYVEGRESEEIDLAVVPYHEWKMISTSLDSKGGQKVSSSYMFSAPNFDILVDSPIEIGNQEVRSFEVSGVRHEVSMYGPKPIQTERFVADLKKIVEAESSVFDLIPYKRYVFLVDFTGNAMGGLEHLSSTHSIIPRLRLIPEEEYKIALGLFSHELFHAWNVKRMRPKGLGPFNYSSETYTKSLWIAEGITSYYDDYILRRSKIYTVGEYLDALSNVFSRLKFLPAAKYESAEESSFDTWVRHYRQNENSPNVHGSYYDQGEVIGWMIDMEIRKSTNCERNLDHVMRELYNQTFVKENRGYTDEEFERICNDVASRNLSEEIFDARVRGHEAYDFDRYLGYAGLKLGSREKVTPNKGFLGVKLRSENGRILIGSKIFSSPADKCGLASGDEIIAIDELRMDLPTAPFYISNKKPGEKITILISRDGYLGTFRPTLEEFHSKDARIFKKEQATNEERNVYKSWLLQDWDDQIVYPDFVQSPLRVKTLDYI